MRLLTCAALPLVAAGGLPCKTVQSGTGHRGLQLPESQLSMHECDTADLGKACYKVGCSVAEVRGCVRHLIV